MLDELVDVIETLKSRINEHRSVLQGNEAQTRLSLIDPLLRALGWDTTDPALVRTEFNLNNGRADYALLNADEKPVAIIEAKRLDESLGTTDHRMQMLTYANFSNVSYAGLTDGNQWVLYKVFDQKSLEERIVLNVSIADTDSAKCALQLLLLWRPNLASGPSIEANEPILGTEPPPLPLTDVPIQAQRGTVPSVPETGWTTLSNFRVVSGKTPPPTLRFSDGEEKQAKNWKAFLVEVTEWLIRDGALTADKCPITVGRNESNCLINLQPRHRDGRAFARYHELSNGLFLHNNYTAMQIVNVCKGIMEHLGKDPASVHVQVG